MNKLPLSLKPGILVGLKSEVRGGVEYKTVALDVPEAEKDMYTSTTGTEVIKKEMTKITADADEHKRATAIRNKARSWVVSECSNTPFGLLCPLGKEEALDAQVVEAEKLVAEFNATAIHTRVDVYVIKGYIADGDEKAARGIANELSELIEKMSSAVTARDPDAIKAAMRKAKALASMVDEDSKARVSKALEAARASAKDIAAMIKAHGNANIALITDTNKAILDEMAESFTVLDLEAPVVVEGEAMAPVSTGELDLGSPADEVLDETANPEDVDASAAVDLDAEKYSAGELAAGSPDGSSDGPEMEL